MAKLIKIGTNADGSPVTLESHPADHPKPHSGGGGT